MSLAMAPIDIVSSGQAGYLGALDKDTAASKPAALDMADVSTTVASETASPPLSPGNSSSSLLSCPWHAAMSYFFTSSDLGRVSTTCKTFRTELTVEAPKEVAEVESNQPSSYSRRLLVVPVVELRINTAEAELQRVSLPHIHVLRIWNRLSLVAAARAAKSVGKQAFRSLDKFTLQKCPLNAMDVKEMLIPMLAATRRLKLLNLERNQLADAPIQQLCSSGMLNRVEMLNIRFNKVSDLGATALAQCKAFATMKWINLKFNNVSDNGAIAFASALRHNRSMTLLNLRKQYPALTDKCTEGFAEMLQTNSTFQQLRLRGNRISDEGAALLAGAAAQRLPRLCKEVPLWEEVRLELDLEDNRIGDEGALALLHTASAAPARAQVEILLSGNTVTRDSLALAVTEAGEESLSADNERLFFTSKAEEAQ